MSTEATGDARTDAAGPAEQPAAGGSTRSGEVSGAVRNAGEDGAAARGAVAADDGPGSHATRGDADDDADGAEAAFTDSGPNADDGSWDDGSWDDGSWDDGTGADGTVGDGTGDTVDEDVADEGDVAKGLGAGPEDAPDDADAPAELIDRAELVELDEPGPVLHPARRWTRVLVTLGFVVLAAAIVGGAVAIVGSVTHGFKKPVKVTYKKSALFSLKTGDCLDPSGQSYTLVSCDTPHDAEVFATFALPGGQWPGNTAVAADASSGCASRLTGYLNPQLAISLASTYVYPDATAWQAGTRTVVCEVRAASGQLTGSVRGASATAG